MIYLYIIYWILGIVTITRHHRYSKEYNVRVVDFLFIIIIASFLGPLYQVATFIENKWDPFEFVLFKNIRK